MAKTLAELRQHRKALAAEFETIVAAEAKGGELTTEQENRLAAIKAESVTVAGEIDTLTDATIGALSTPEQVASAVAAGAAKASAAAIEIVALCAVAKAPASLAHGFLRANKSLDDVRAELVADRADDRTETINPKRGIQSPEKASSWGKAVAKANARVPAGK